MYGDVVESASIVVDGSRTWEAEAGIFMLGYEPSKLSESQEIFNEGENLCQIWTRMSLDRAVSSVEDACDNSGLQLLLISRLQIRIVPAMQYIKHP